MEKASLAQGKQVLDLLSSASVAQVQNLVGAGDLIRIMMDADPNDLKGVDREQFRQLLKVIVNPYASEQCELTSFYPEGFAMPTLEVQAGRLQKALGFEPKWPEAAQNLPFQTGEFGTDGIGLWPCLPFLGQLWEVEDPRVAGYGKVIAATCTKFDEWSRAEMKAPLVNYRMQDADKLTQPDYVRIVEETMGILVPLEDAAMSQGYNCLAMPVNLGNWGTGLTYSPRNALWQTLHWDPNGLAIEPVAGLSLAIGTKVLTAYEHQWKDFPGAQYNWERDGRWSRSLCLHFRDGRFGFGASGAHSALDDYGSLFARPGVSELAA